MRNISDNIFREYQNTFCVQYFSFSDNRAVYERMWENIVEPDRPKMKYNAAHSLCMLDN